MITSDGKMQCNFAQKCSSYKVLLQCVHLVSRRHCDLTKMECMWSKKNFHSWLSGIQPNQESVVF